MDECEEESGRYSWNGGGVERPCSRRSLLALSLPPAS